VKYRNPVSQRQLRFIRLIGLVFTVLALSACNWTHLVSTNSSAIQGNANSEGAAVSADGRFVAFSSDASNLVSGDTNGVSDIFVHDTKIGTTIRVSVDTTGNEGSQQSAEPSISGDGRYIVFSSTADNLVPGDTNNTSDVFVHDVVTGVTSRVSVDILGNEGNRSSDSADISVDGNFIAFASFANNLTLDDTDDKEDVFVIDMDSGNITRVVAMGSEHELNSPDLDLVISANGRYVAFKSIASALVLNDTNDHFDVFVHDLNTATTSRVSVDSDGIEGDNSSFGPEISADGRYVAFHSGAGNLVNGDDNEVVDTFVHDRDTGLTTRVSVDSAGNEGDSHSTQSSISADGRFIAFHSLSSNLVAGDTNDQFDVFLRDTVAGTTTFVARDALGEMANGAGFFPSISADGRYVAFTTIATNLVANDTNGSGDVVIRAIPQVLIDSITPSQLSIGATTSVVVTGSNFLVGAAPAVSGAQVSNVVIIDEETLSLDLTVPAHRLPGVSTMMVNLYGTGPGLFNGAAGICEDCVTFQ